MPTVMKEYDNTPPLFLGDPEEERFNLLAAGLELGEGFDLFILGFAARISLKEVERRLSNAKIENMTFVSMPMAHPSDLVGLPARLRSQKSPESGRLALLITSESSDDEARAAWTKTLSGMNTERNSIIRRCPHAVVLAGPEWLIKLTHDVAPDLWSVRTGAWRFSDPPHATAPRSAASEYPRDWDQDGWFAHQLKEGDYYEALANSLVQNRRSLEHAIAVRLLNKAGHAHMIKGQLDDALQVLNRAVDLAEELGEVGEIAEAKVGIADILYRRGDLEGALRICEEEVLPVYEQLGSVQKIAIAKGIIADILYDRGDLKGALSILETEQLPVFEQHGNQYFIAITKGKIADILYRQGMLDGALSILKTEALPVLEHQGDARQVAVIKGKIADILYHRGELEEALRIRKEEQLPVYERLGDILSVVVTKTNMAIYLLNREGAGDRERACVLLREALPLAEQLQISEVDMIRKMLSEIDCDGEVVV